MKDGFVKTAAGTPDIKVADCGYNCARIKALIDKAHEQGVRVLVLPELCITGYTCQDLFFQQTLLDGALNALKDITEHSAGLDMLIAVGCPLRFRGELYNCAVVMKDGKILGVVPKKFLPNYNEFYEKRHFTAAPEGEYDIELFGESVPFGLGLLFECRGTPELVFAAEICEDLWAAEPPSISLAAARPSSRISPPATRPSARIPTAVSLSTASPRGCCAGTCMQAQDPAKARRILYSAGTI